MITDKLAPSILAADFGAFRQVVETIEASKAEMVHIDVMDGHFVDNLTFGADVVRAIRPATKCFLDCHMMVTSPEKYISAFAQAGADGMTIHVEATAHSHGCLQKIRAAGMRTGIAVNPGTPIEHVYPLLALCDMVLIMTVNPGFGGQSFIPETLDKIQTLVKHRAAQGLEFDIQVDGGVDDKTIQACKQAGANVFVAGSFVFKGDVAHNVQQLREALHA